MPTTTIPAGEVSLFIDYTSRALDEPGSDKPTLIFAHGFPDSHSTWAEQVEAFRHDYHVAAFDLRGVGASTAPREAAGYRIDRVLPDFAAVIDFMVGPAGKVHLIGHDWGGLLGWRFVSEPRYAARLHSFTAIAGPHPDLAFTLNRDRLLSLSPAQWREAAIQNAKSWYIWFFQLPLVPEALISLAPEHWWQFAHRLGGARSGDPVLAADRREVLATTLKPLNLYRQMVRTMLLEGPKLPTRPIQVPCQVIIPDQDIALQPSVYTSLSKFVTDLEVHHLDANHWVHRDKPAVVNDLIRSFLVRHPGT